MFHVCTIRIKAATRLIAELDQGASFRSARKRVGVAWWEILIWCLRGRQRFHTSPFSPQDKYTTFLLALADTRRRMGTSLGPVLNWLVRPFEPAISQVSQHA